MSGLIIKYDTELKHEVYGKVKAENLEGGLKDFYFEFEQGTPALVWDVITENCLKFGSVTILDQNGFEMEGLIKRISYNHTQIIFNNETAGKAFFN